MTESQKKRQQKTKDANAVITSETIGLISVDVE